MRPAIRYAASSAVLVAAVISVALYGIAQPTAQSFASRIERLSENIDIFDFSLDDDDMAVIAGLASPKGRFTDYGFAPKWD